MALFILNGNSVSHAELIQNEQQAKQHTLTAENVLKSMLYPTLIQIVNEQYGGPNVDWRIKGVENIALKTENKKVRHDVENIPSNAEYKKVGYEVVLSLEVSKTPSKVHYDHVTLNIDAYNPNKNDITLINYQKGK